MKSFLRLSVFVCMVVFVVAFLTLRIAGAAYPSDIPTGTPPPPPTGTPVTPTETPDPTITPVSPTPRPSEPPVEAPGPTATPEATPTVLVTLPDTGGPTGGVSAIGLLFVLAGAFMLTGIGFLVWRQKRAL